MRFHIKKWYIYMVSLIGVFVFTGCVSPQATGLNSFKKNPVGFSVDGLHSRETAAEIYRRSPTSAKRAYQGIAVRDVVQNDDNEGFYKNALYGREAYINLIFTKRGGHGKLYKIVVDWRDGARFFQGGIFDHQAVAQHYNKVASQLIKKYGKNKRKGLWKPNSSTTIKLYKTTVGVKLVFTDNLSSPTNGVTKSSVNKKEKTSANSNLINVLSSTINIGRKLKIF